MQTLVDAGYRVIAPNQRGYSPGARPTDVSDYQLLHMVDDALEIATVLGAETFHLAGTTGEEAWHGASRRRRRSASHR